MASFIEPYAPSLQEMDEQRNHQGQMPIVMPREIDEVLSPETKLAIQREGRAAFAAYYAETRRIWAVTPKNPYGPLTEIMNPGQRNRYTLYHVRAKQWREGFEVAQAEEASGMAAILRAEKAQEPQENRS